MPNNTDFFRTARRQAVLSTLVSAVWLLLTAAILLLARHFWRMVPPLSAILAILAALDILSLIPLALSLRNRLKEIQGGEEYEARQY